MEELKREEVIDSALDREIANSEGVRYNSDVVGENDVLSFGQKQFNMSIYVQGEQHLRTKELRKLQLIRFLPQTSEVDEQALEVLWKKGRKAWGDVPSATEWVEKLRGNH